MDITADYLQNAVGVPWQHTPEREQGQKAACSATPTAAGSAAPQRCLEKQKTDDGDDCEMLPEEQVAKMQGDKSKPPPPEAQQQYFWSAMRSLTREENTEMNNCIQHIDQRVNSVGEHLGQSIEEEATARKDMAAMVDGPANPETQNQWVPMRIMLGG